MRHEKNEFLCLSYLVPLPDEETGREGGEKVLTFHIQVEIAHGQLEYKTVTENEKLWLIEAWETSSYEQC